LGLTGLRVTLHALRRALAPLADSHGDDLVMNIGHVYFVNPAASVWIDTDAFTTHFESGLRFERQGLPRRRRARVRRRRSALS
jgi:hypothetical protein